MTWLFVSTSPDAEITTPEPAVWSPLDSVDAMLTIAGLTEVATLRTFTSVEVVEFADPNSLGCDPPPVPPPVGAPALPPLIRVADVSERPVSAIPAAVPASSAIAATATSRPSNRGRRAAGREGGAGQGETGGGPTGGEVTAADR